MGVNYTLKMFLLSLSCKVTYKRFCLQGLCILLFSLFLFSCSKEISVDTISDEETKYRIMIVPDIQNYMDTPKRFKYVEAIADYYVENKSTFTACLQVGDLTNNNQTLQYQNAFEHFFRKFPEG